MEDEEKEQIKGGMEQVKKDGKNLKEKADKTKKAIKIFQKLPIHVKIAIIAVPVIVIMLIVFFGGFIGIIEKWNFDNIYQAKAAAFGNGTSYSDQIVKIGNGMWNVNISEDIKKQLDEAGIKYDKNTTQDELLIKWLELKGLESDEFSDEEIETIPYLIKAEIASQSVDLRSASEMYSNGEYKSFSEEQISENLKNNKINGVVHFKRVNTGGEYEPTYLEYIDYSKFSEYVNNNNKEAIKYFSFNEKGEMVIATWRYNKVMNYLEKGKIDNPLDEKEYPNYEQNYIEEMVIDYKPLISKYSLPFEVLAALLINSEDVEFTKKIANLAFTSNIEITIFERYTYINSIVTDKYYESIRNYQYINIYGKYKYNGLDNTRGKNNEYSFIEKNTSSEDFVKWNNPENVKINNEVDKNKYTYKIENYTADNPSYILRQEIETKDNTYVYSVTFADSWFIKTGKEYTIIQPENAEPKTADGEYKDKYNYYDTYSTNSKDEIDKSKIKTEYLEEYYEKNKNAIESEINSEKQAYEEKVARPEIYITEEEVKYINIKCNNPSTIIIRDADEKDRHTFYNSTYQKIPYSDEYKNITVANNYATYNYSYSDILHKYTTGDKVPSNPYTHIGSDYSQITTMYRKTDKNTHEETTVKEYGVQEDIPKSTFYDGKNEKFLKAYDESTKAKGNIGSTPGWLEESLNEYSPEVTTIIEYLLDKYKGKNVELDESISGILEADTYTNSSSGSYWDQFLKFLHSWESDGKTTTNEKGEKCYIVIKDGSGGSAVGYGVDIDTHGKELRALGYDTSLGALIPVEVVDKIEKDALKSTYKQISTQTSDLKLTEYQKLALLSRCYNYGFTGGLKRATKLFIYPSNEDFVSAYKKYYSKEDNEKYFGDYTKTDFTNKLFTEYMTWLDYAKTGAHPKGWEYRRKAEWSLFQTGYYGYDLKYGTGHGIDEYFQDTQDATDMTNNIKLYNDDGTVNEKAIEQLNKWITVELLNTKYHWRTMEMQNGPFAKWWDSKNNWFTSAGYKFQCTWYVYGRASQYLELSKSKYKSWPGTKNNAKNWYKASTNGGEKYFECGSTPRANSIAVWKDGNNAGHVAYVEAVDEINQKVYISHAGGGKSWFGVQSKTVTEMKTLWGYQLLGYVYLDRPK